MKRTALPLFLSAVLAAACAGTGADGSSSLVAPPTSAPAEVAVVLPGAPVVGEPFSFALPTINGGVVDSGALRGQVVVVDFWATWCVPCKREIPALKALYEEHHDDGLEIVGLSFDRDLAPLVGYVEDNDLPWPQVFLGDHQIMVSQTTGVVGIPAVFVIDREGRLHTDDGRGRLEQLLAELL